jgi:myosin heavy subunit
MKKIFILPTFISLAMICSCQKQESAAEQELAQRKTDLDARENALDERMNALDGKVKALDEKVNALAEKEKTTANARTIPTDVQPQISDPAQVQAERDAAIQRFSTEIRARIPDNSKMKAEKDGMTQERLLQRQRGLEQLQSQKQSKFEMSGRAIFPAPQATLPSSSPGVGAPSPASSPAAEATLPTPSPTP